jgi:tRNA(fMet)-specific endonuclease VapC
MPVILDTNTISLLREGEPLKSGRLVQRMRQISKPEIWTTVISYQEQLKGWLAAIHRARNDRQLLWAFAALQNTLTTFSRLPVMPFDEAALAVFHQLQSQRLKVGTNDLRIAAIALARGATVVTQNLRDFQRVPGLIVEDGTI